MKKIFTYFGLVLSIALMGAFTACNPIENEQTADLGLNIKVFFPTKVVAGQPMTINGTGLSDVTEIVFPDGITVTNFEKVGGEMLRVVAPSGISAGGGKLIVRTASDEAESRQDLTLGSTAISGYSKQDGEEINGGDQLTIYGQDLEFISRIELMDTDGNPLILEDEDFYRKGTSTVIITIPKTTIFDGTFVGKVYTFDGKVFNLPELTYIPGSEGGGHWEEKKVVIWENPGAGAVAWNGTYRFAGEGFGTGEEIAVIPADIWARMKTETFYLDIEATDPQVRVTTGWWSGSWADKDFQPGNDERLVDNGDGTWTLAITLSDPAYLDLIDEQHLLFTGDRYTPLRFYFIEQEWIPGGGHMEIVKTSIWKNEGAGGVAWNGTYRFAGEGHSTGEEIYTIPADIWEKMKTEPFYLDVEATDPQIRVTTGWWSGSWCDKDFQPGNDERLVDNGDGTWTLTITLSDPAYLDLIDEQHLLFTGDRYTPIEIYFAEEVWVDDGGDSGPKQVVFWENPGAGGVAWNGTYRFGLEGNDGNNECIATFPQDIWDKIKSSTFYLELTPDADWYNVRVTNGWWDTSWNVGDIGANSDRMIDNGDGTFHIEINISDDADFLGTVDQKHILFTGEGYTPVKLYFQ